MANPRIKWDPGTGIINLDFPEQLTSLPGTGRTVRRRVNETQGGVVAVHFQNFAEIWEARIEKMYGLKTTVDTFIKDVEAFWAWAGKGGEFQFILDNAKSFDAILDRNHAAGVTLIQHGTMQSGSVPIVGDVFYLTSKQDGWQREAVDVIAPVVVDQNYTIAAPTKFAYLTDDRTNERKYFRKCIAVQDKQPIVEDSGHKIDFRLRFQTFEDIEVA